MKKYMSRKKVRCMMLILMLLAGSLLTTKVLADKGNPNSDATDTYEDNNPLYIIQDTISYDDYLSQHEGVAMGEKSIAIPGGSCKEKTAGFEVLSNYEGMKGDALSTLEDGAAVWEAEIPEEGFYNIEISYYPIKGKNGRIERELYINGEIPFTEAKYLEFSRIWTNESEIRRDSRNYDIRPRQVEQPDWITVVLQDSEGFYSEGLRFYFKKGRNTITLKSTKEPMVVGSITLTSSKIIPSYEEYTNKCIAQEYGQESIETIKLQGEEALYKSDSTLYPISDRTSPKTEPASTAKTRLNEIGGGNWKMPGQWIEWEVNVPKDGLYELAIKYRQNISSGKTVTRALYIDGEIPFREASELKFYYRNDWQIAALGQEERYQFLLTAGIHKIRLQVVLGNELSEILRITDNCVYQLNTAYRQLLMVIGSTPDTMRDYQLDIKTPEAIKIIEEQYQVVQELYNKVEHYSKGSKGSESAVLVNLLNQLGTMYAKPKTIAKQWNAFKDNIIALSSWALSMKEQPLEIDYLLIQETGSELPDASAGFFSKLVHEMKCFAATFTEDYDSIGEIYGTEALEVWILADAAATSMSAGGRDQATVIKNLVDNYFVPDTNTPVNVKLVNKDVLLSATLAGEGPDVALNVAGKEPVNYALRNAAADLTQFEDFNEVRSWFYKEALKQFTLGDGVYALPQTMSFHVMFYRADILDSLGIAVPETWDEFYDCLTVIQKNNMNVGIYPDYTTFAMFLYQHGGEYYENDGTSSALDSEEAISAFEQWSSNYSNYRMPVEYNFVNRFRSGEMPLAICDYTNYNYLSVFAPEIKGLWGFTVVPGYQKEDGSYDHSVSSWETASILLATSKQKEAGWEFLKWWMSKETQTSYGNEIENILGVAGRVATANMEALNNLPWSNHDYEQLVKQLQWVKAIPEVPGGYFTERHIKNAFYTVYNNKEDPRETLEDFVKTINNELTNKRLEFGLKIH